jgi:hypothetical protein
VQLNRSLGLIFSTLRQGGESLRIGDDSGEESEGETWFDGVCGGTACVLAVETGDVKAAARVTKSTEAMEVNEPGRRMPP